jgi:hypothetical protein
MLSILTEDSNPPRAAEPVPLPPDPPAPQPIQIDEEAGDYELVLGRRQLASVLFVATVIVVLFSSISYLAGKSLAPAPKIIERVRVETVHDPAPAPVSAPATIATPEVPVFANPKDGSLYIQVGSVEKGIATIFVDGLRRQGFEAFAAPGASEKTFRVLIGPLDEAGSYQRAKKMVDDLELTAFARRYQQ